MNLIEFLVLLIVILRGVHRPVPKSAGHNEAEAPGERAVYQHAGPGQRGDEGSVLTSSDGEAHSETDIFLCFLITL